MKPNDYSNERYLVVYWNNGRLNKNHTEEGFLIIYDFVSMKGHLCLFTSNRDFDYLLYDFTATINNNQIDMCVRLDNNLNGRDMLTCDDDFADLSFNGIEFFDIIHKSDEETEAAQLNASLMKLSHIINS